MKVIFLDIDGVLNGERSLQMRREREIANLPLSKFYEIQEKYDGFIGLDIDEEKVEILGRMVQETNAKVVLSSSLRFDWANGTKKITRGSSKGLQFLFDKYGIQIIGVTPRVPRGGIYSWRENEIKTYLIEHPEIDSFLVIDDNVEQLQTLKDFLIQTTSGFLNNEEGGLQEYHLRKAMKILNEKTIDEIEL